MNKDVIYIDVEDDITAIIGKVKDSKEKIVALVPPKRIGVLQSAVNLQLLVRMAKNASKQLVIVTNNQALVGLSAAASIPVAKNLQSKPEIAEIPALSVDDGEDIIDGSQLPVGELEKTADAPQAAAASSSVGAFVRPSKPPVEDLVDAIDVDSEDAVAPVVGLATAPKRAVLPKNKTKVPNFSKFRKKLFIGIGALIVLIAFLLWANIVAPAATIVITAKTIPTPVSETVNLNGANATSVSAGNIKTDVQTLKKNVTIKFTATGQQDVGTKASGTVTITRNGVSDSSTTIPVGTGFSSGNQTFLTTSTAVVPASQIQGNRLNNGSVTVNVQAANPGTAYNLAATNYQSSVDGFSAQGSDMTGGTSKIATVVTQSDIDTATAALKAQSNASDKSQLFSQFSSDEVIVTDSFNANQATPTSSPALGAEADSQATLTSAVTYTASALAKSDIELFLKDSLTQQISGETDQRIYDDGIKNVKVSGYSGVNALPTVTISTTGQVGPNIDTNTIKNQSKGKKSGEIQASLSSITGVENVTTKYSYPWVTTVPNDTSKIDVQFKLTNG